MISHNKSIAIASPNIVPSLRANFKWTLTGNMIYGACQWGMISTLAKLSSPAVVGQFTLALAITAPVFTFTSLQLRSVQATDVRSECVFADCFTLRLLSTILGLAVIVALLPFAAASPAVRAVILLVAISKCIECMSDVSSGLLQREERLDRIAISLILRGAASVLVFSLTFAWLHNLVVSVAGMAGVWLAVLVLYDVPNSRALLSANEGFFRFDRRALRKLIMLALPLGLVSGLATLSVNIPRYLLQHYLGSADQGVYASLAYLIVAINLVMFALSQSATARLARMFAAGEFGPFRRLLMKLSMFGVVIVAVGVPLAFLFGRPLLTLLYRREYGDHVGLLALFVGISGLSAIGSFLFCGMSAARSFRAQVPVYFAATLTAVVGSAILVPRYGLIGAGIALLLSTVTVVLGGLRVMHSVLGAEQR